MLRRYIPSGRCSTRVIPALVVLLAVVTAAALAYQWGLDHIGVRKVPFFLASALAGALWFGAWGAMIAGKSRAPVIGLLAGMLAAATALGVSHAVKYRQAVAKGAPTRITENFTWRAAQGIGGRPATASRPARPPEYKNGTARAIWWLEAGVMLIAGALGGIGGSCRPFCESCQRPADDVHWTLRLDRPSEASVRRVRKADTIADLRAAPYEPTGPEGSSLEYEVKVCPVCAGVPTLNVTQRTKVGGSALLSWLAGWFWNDDGSSELHSRLLLNDEDLDVLTAWAAGLPGFEATSLREGGEADAQGAL